MRRARPAGRPTLSFELSVGPAPSHRAALVATGRTPKPPIQVTAFVDTGADGTFVTERVADELELPTINAVIGQGFHGHTERHRVVLCELRMPNGQPFTTRVSVVRDQQRPHHDMLIGMDIVSHAQLEYRAGDFALMLAEQP